MALKKAQRGLLSALIVLMVILIILIAILIFIQVSFFTGFAITGWFPSVDFIEDSPIKMQSYELEGFNKIDVQGKGNLFLTQDEEYDVKIEAEENVLELLDVKVEDETLIIGKKRTLLIGKKLINIFISMPETREIKISGSGGITSENQIKGDELDIRIAGSSDVEMDLEVDKLITKISGSGDIVYQGIAENHVISIAGSGDINALELESEITHVIISGSGDVEVYTTEELDIQISGFGNVKYKGDPEISQSVSGRGKVRSV